MQQFFPVFPVIDNAARKEQPIISQKVERILTIENITVRIYARIEREYSGYDHEENECQIEYVRQTKFLCLNI